MQLTLSTVTTTANLGTLTDPTQGHVITEHGGVAQRGTVLVDHVLESRGICKRVDDAVPEALLNNVAGGAKPIYVICGSGLTAAVCHIINQNAGTEQPFRYYGIAVGSVIYGIGTYLQNKYTGTTGTKAYKRDTSSGPKAMTNALLEHGFTVGETAVMVRRSTPMRMTTGPRSPQHLGDAGRRLHDGLC